MGFFSDFFGVAGKSDIESVSSQVVGVSQALEGSMRQIIGFKEQYAGQITELQKGFTVLDEGLKVLDGKFAEYTQQALGAQEQMATALTVVALTIIVCIAATLIYQHIKERKIDQERPSNIVTDIQKDYRRASIEVDNLSQTLG